MKIRLSHPAIGEIAFPLAEGGQVVLGRRGGGSGVELNWDAKISRRHARVWIEGGTLWVEDLQSRNGTWLEGERLRTPHAVTIGERIRVGETAFEPVVRDAMGEAETGAATCTIAGAASDDVLQAETRVDRRPSTSSAPGITLETPPVPKPPTIRFLAEGVVGVEVESRESFRQLWSGDLAKAGLFVPTDLTFDFGKRLEVRFKTPQGVLSLTASVVHVVDGDMAKRFAMAQGVGLQLVDVDDVTRRRADRYADGDADDLEIESADQRSSNDIADALRIAKRLIAYVERDDYYKAIELPPEALQSEVDARIVEIERCLVSDDLPPPQAMRITAACRSVERVKDTIANVEQRLRYDFRREHIHAERRLRAAADKIGPDIGVLRRAWVVCFPTRVEHAQTLLKRAFELRRARQFEEALVLGREAQHHDPFWMELRRTVETWEALTNHSIAV